jgi:hypothetical protein
MPYFNVANRHPLERIDRSMLYNPVYQYLPMPVETKEISVTGKEDCGIADITEEVSDAVKNSRIKNGAVTIFCIGSTGAITTMEFEPNLSKDVSEALDRIIPLDMDYHPKRQEKSCCRYPENLRTQGESRILLIPHPAAFLLN